MFSITATVAVDEVRPCGHFASVGHRFSPNNLLLHRSSYGRGVRQGYVAPPSVIVLVPRLTSIALCVTTTSLGHDIIPMGYLDLLKAPAAEVRTEYYSLWARRLIPL